MAMTRLNSGLGVVLDTGRTYFEHKRDEMGRALARRKVFLETRHALSILPDRALADLGIARSDITRLAREAAYEG